MLKALISRQFLEFKDMYFRNRKTGKMRTPLGIAGYIALLLFCFSAMAFAFGTFAFLLADGFLPLGYDWLYFALLGMTSILLSSILAMFLASAELFRAKDNELLLSMPIPPSKILFARMSALYVWCLLYETLAFLPTIIVYWICSETVTAATVILPLAVLLVCSLLVLALSCLFGWIVAAISARLRNRSIVTVLLSLTLIGAYYFFCLRLNQLLSEVVLHADEIGEFVHGALVPVYWMGKAASGDALSLLPVAAICLAVFGVAYWALSRSFVRITTANRGEKKVVYHEQTAKQVGIPAALRGKELRRFVSSPVYLLNAGLGIVILPIIGIVLAVKADTLRAAVGTLTAMLPEAAALVPCAVALAGCFALSMIDFTAPAISLEGKTIWLLQSMPVEPYAVLREKIRTQLLLSIVPVLILLACTAYALRLSLSQTAAVFVLLAGYASLSATAGLCIDLRHPILNWTNETIPVKQNISALICIFGGWLLAAAFGAGAWFLRNVIESETYLILSGVVLLLLGRLLDRWLRTKGAAMFAAL